MPSQQRSQQRSETYTTADIYTLPDNVRAELINGRLYPMETPNRIHQQILQQLGSIIMDHIEANDLHHHVYISRLAVFPFADDQNYVEPDVTVICDESKLNDLGCNGAPDWIIEITSDHSKAMDYYRKPSLYLESGVRLYWIVDPERKFVWVYDLEHEAAPEVYDMTSEIPVEIYPGFSVDFSELCRIYY